MQEAQLIRQLMDSRAELLLFTPRRFEGSENELLRQYFPHTFALVELIKSSKRDHPADGNGETTPADWLWCLPTVLKAKSDYGECERTVREALEEQIRIQEAAAASAADAHPSDERQNILGRAMHRFVTSSAASTQHECSGECSGDGAFAKLARERDSARVRWHQVMEETRAAWPPSRLQLLQDSLDASAVKMQACLWELHFTGQRSAGEGSALLQEALRYLAGVLDLSAESDAPPTLVDVMKSLVRRTDEDVRNFKRLNNMIDECASRMCCCALSERRASSRTGCRSGSGSRCSCGALPPPAGQLESAWYVSRWINVSLPELEANFQSLKKQLRQAEKQLHLKKEELKDFNEDNPYASAAAKKAFERSIQLAETQQMRQTAKRRLVEARSYLATLAMGPFAEVPYAMHLVGLRSVEVPEVATRFLLPDRTLSDYEDVQRINGFGGRHAVYRATLSGRTVALKEYRVSHGSHEAAVRSFWREARLLSKQLASHEGFIKITGIFTETRSVESFAYVELPYLPSGNLRQFLTSAAAEGRPVSMMQRLAMLRNIASAMAYMHSEGVLHCDIKPENILVTDSGRPVIGDFDIARDSNERATLLTAAATTAAGGVAGTLAYMAPELRHPSHPSMPTEKSDVYSFGKLSLDILLEYRCSDAAGATTAGHTSSCSDAYQLLQSLDINAACATALAQCCAEDPNARPSAAELLSQPGVFPSDVEMVQMLDEVQQQLAQLKVTIDEKEAERQAKREQRRRICCLCHDEVDVSLGIACCSTEDAAKRGLQQHFHCDECFSDLVRHEVSQHWTKLRWVEILVNGESATRKIRRKIEAVRQLDIAELRGDACAFAFNEVETNLWYDLSGFRGAFEVVNLMEDELCFPCSHADPAPERCTCFFDGDAVARHIDPPTAILYRGALQDLRAHRETHRLRCVWEEEKRRLEATSLVQQLRRRVEEEIFNSKCPACGQALDEGGNAFEACAALRCKIADNVQGVRANMGCGAAFCAFCLEPCGRDAHGHVRNCVYNPQRGGLFVSAQQYAQAVKERQIRKLREFLRDLQQPIRDELLESILIQLRNLGISIDDLRV